MIFSIFHHSDAMDRGSACLRMISEHSGKRYTLEHLRRNCFIGRDGVSLLGISREMSLDEYILFRFNNEMIRQKNIFS